MITGALTLTNKSAGPATIGNVVVNLQTRVNKQWVTVSSDIADATQGDAATAAVLHAQASSEGLAAFSENGASGALAFTDATSGYIAYRRSSLLKMREQGGYASRGHYYQTEARLKATRLGLRTCELPIVYRGSSSSLNWTSLREALWLTFFG